MKFIISSCFALLFSLFLFNCAQKDSSPTYPEETYNLYKGKPDKNIAVYNVSGDIVGEGQKDNITLYYGEIFRQASTYFGEDENDGKEGFVGMSKLDRRTGKRTFVHFFDWVEDVQGWQGKFTIEGYFERKESFPLTFDGGWRSEYYLSYEDVVIIEGDGAVVTVDVVN